MTNLNLDLIQKTEIIKGLYLGILGREADAAGLKHWLNIWENGGNTDFIINCLVNSEEYKCGKQSTMRNAVNAVNHALEAVKFLPPFLQERPLTIVDVGAQNLEYEEHIYSEIATHQLPHQIIGFEPLEDRLQERLNEPECENFTLLPAFIGDGQEHTFYINAPDATSSLLPFNEAVISKFIDLDTLETVNTEPAKTTTLDIALQDQKYVDFLKLDIQGAELAALRHAPIVLSKTLVVHCEVSFFEIYKDQALFSEVELYMRSMGFELIDVCSQCRYPLSNTSFTQSRDWLGWGDAVFLRRLEENAHWQDKLIQSLIALIVYKKPSLAAYLAHGLEDSPAQKYAQVLNS